MDFHFRKFEMNGASVALQLWDIAGQDRFGALYRIYYRDAFGAMLVFDLSRPETFQSVLKVRGGRDGNRRGLLRARLRKIVTVRARGAPLTRKTRFARTPPPPSPSQWKREIDSKVTLPNGSPLPVVLLANKSDLPDTRVEKEQLDAFCKEHGFTGWYETSAKSNLNIEEAVKGLVAACLSHPDAYEAHRLKNAAATAAAGTVSLAEEGKDDKAAQAKGGCC